MNCCYLHDSNYSAHWSWCFHHKLTFNKKETTFFKCLLMLGITFLFHWCVCDISCQYVSWHCRTLLSYCKELPQSTVGLVSFAAGVSYLFISVTDFCCMIQIDDDDDDGYINVDNDITFLYKTEHSFSFFFFSRTQPHFCFSCFSCSCMIDCDTVSCSSKFHPVVTNETVTTESHPRSESSGCLKFASHRLRFK
jgi:hypothetical protein